MEWSRTLPSGGWWALTGTPGVGKSTVLRALPPRRFGIELADLALGFGGRRGRGRVVEVDLPRLARYLSAHRPGTPVILAGHLAHRLPVEGIFVLRCHPAVLDRRLAARGDAAAARSENFACEAIDLVAAQARARRRPVLEVDTTRRSPASVAARLDRALAGGPVAPDRVDWLSEAAVTARLIGGGG